MSSVITWHSICPSQAHTGNDSQPTSALKFVVYLIIIGLSCASYLVILIYMIFLIKNLKVLIFLICYFLLSKAIKQIAFWCYLIVINLTMRSLWLSPKFRYTLVWMCSCEINIIYYVIKSILLYYQNLFEKFYLMKLILLCTYRYSRTSVMLFIRF